MSINNRKLYENKLLLEIKQLKIYNSRDEALIVRLRDSKSDDYTKSRYEKALKNIEERNNNIKDMEDEIILNKQGLLDYKISEEINQSTETFKNKSNIHNLKINKIKDDNDIENNKVKKKIQEDKKENRDIKINNKEMDRAYKSYQYQVSTIPDYILNYLKNMPNNHGYIFKDIYMYGELPAQENKPVKLEQRISKDQTVIHEWFNGKYKRYDKFQKRK